MALEEDVHTSQLLNDIAAGNVDENSEDAKSLFEQDAFRMYCYKILPCAKRQVHDWTTCCFAHPGEKARRRDPRVHKYLAIPCPEVKQNQPCPRGESCQYCHSVFEYWLHPSRYRTQMCQNGTNCKRSVCFFAHTVSDLRVPDYSHLNIPPELVAADNAAKADKAKAKPARPAAGASDAMGNGASSSYYAGMTPARTASGVPLGSGSTSSRTSMDRTSLDMPRSPAAPMTPGMSPGWCATGLPPTCPVPLMDVAMSQLAAARYQAFWANANAAAAGTGIGEQEGSGDMSTDSILMPGMLAQQRAMLRQQQQQLQRRSGSSDCLAWRMSGDYSRMSGDYSRLSGDYLRMSGDYSRVSGEYPRVSSEFTRVPGEGSVPLSPRSAAGVGLDGALNGSSPSGPMPQLHPSALDAAVAAAAAHLQGGLAVGTPMQSPGHPTLQAMLARSTSGNASALLSATAMASPSTSLAMQGDGPPRGVFTTSSCGALPPLRPTAVQRAASLDAAMLLQQCSTESSFLSGSAGGSSNCLTSPPGGPVALGLPSGSIFTSYQLNGVAGLPPGPLQGLTLEAAAAAAAAGNGTLDAQGLAQLSELIDVVNRNPDLTNNELLMGLINKALVNVDGMVQQQRQVQQQNIPYGGYLT